MFSILIPTWNNLDYLRMVVQSIRRHSAHAHQIIVHVNDGSDGTREWVMQQQLDATFSTRNVGICLAVNEAAQLAAHDYIVYLNDDMVCLPGWDTALLKRIKTMPDELFMLSGTMVEPKDSGNPCVVVADHGDTVAGFRETDLLKAAPGLRRHRHSDHPAPCAQRETTPWDTICRAGTPVEVSPHRPEWTLKCGV